MSLRELYQFCLSDLALSTRYHPRRPGLLCAGAANGELSLFDYTLEDLTSDWWPRQLHPKRTKLLETNAMLYCIDWCGEGALCAVATSAQRIFVEDAERAATLLTLRGHQSSVKTVRACPFNAQLLLSGGRDGQTLLFDLRVGPGSVLTVACGRERVTGAEFFDDERLALTTCVDTAAVEVWDLRKSLSFNRTFRAFSEKRSSHLLLRLRPEFHVENALRELHRQVSEEPGAVSPQLLASYARLRSQLDRTALPAAKDGVNCLVVAHRSATVFCSLLSHRVLAFDCDNVFASPPRELGGFRANVLSRCAVDPAESFLAQGSGQSLCLWNLAAEAAAEPHMHPLAHALDVNCVDFAAAAEPVLCSVGDDCQGKIWRFEPAVTV